MRTALAAFVGSLDRVRDITLEIDSSLSRALRDAAVLRRHETMQCASTVILSGYFESFLGLMAEAFIRALCMKNIPFNRLPLKIRTAHFSEGAEVLAKCARQEAKTVRRDPANRDLTDSEGIVRRMASVVSGGAYELIWEAFAETRTNLGPDALREFLSRFDVDGAWSKLAGHTRLSEASMETLLRSFLSIRNECAHSGTATTIPTPSDIRGYCDLLQTIAEGITTLLEAHLAGPSFPTLPDPGRTVSTS